VSEQEIATQILIINYETVIRDLKQDIGWDEEALAEVLDTLEFRVRELKEVWLGQEYKALPEGEDN
jgi:ribosome-binding protein aMBF1 (putative translation factor)